MTALEAKRKQNEILAQGYDLGWWYGTNCKKCCGVFPKLMFAKTYDPKDCYYQCEVCSKRTELKVMPWQAKEAWNNDECHYESLQMSLF